MQKRMASNLTIDVQCGAVKFATIKSNLTKDGTKTIPQTSNF
ncbi:hypothetical protein [Campylobacter showae]|nr:hypothetical protein [Campylobacter showae]